MWNSYWSGRARRDIPQVNYNESSEEDNEDDFNSPLVSPSRPPPTRAGSPVELAVPTLCDNVDDELEEVRQTLRNVSHTHTFRGTRPDPEGGAVDSEEPTSIPASHTGEEEIVEGLVVGESNNLKVEAVGNGANSDNMTDEVDFDLENERDGEKAIEYSRTLKVDFIPSNVEFWFMFKTYKSS